MFYVTFVSALYWLPPAAVAALLPWVLLEQVAKIRRKYVVACPLTEDHAALIL